MWHSTHIFKVLHCSDLITGSSQAQGIPFGLSSPVTPRLDIADRSLDRVEVLWSDEMSASIDEGFLSTLCGFPPCSLCV
jgi:hypothetical protein